MGAKGIDIFRVYQTVWSWPQVRDSGIEYCWIKATHGLGIATYNADRNYAPAPADPTVAGARSVGIAPGLYHWGKGNDPAAEADLFASEVLRLGCHGPGTLPPALDAEDGAIGPSWAARRAWCIAFLRRLQERIGQQRVAIYMNASWAQALRPDQWDIPGLVIWIAAYGANNGQRSTRSITDLYDGHYDVQQFTSLGLHLVPGITSEGLDVNEADTALENLLEGGDMSVEALLEYELPNYALEPDEKGEYPKVKIREILAWTDARTNDIPRKLLQAQVPNPLYDPNDPRTGKASYSFEEWFVYTNVKTDQNTAQITALTEVVKALALAGGHDPDALLQLVDRKVDEALANVRLVRGLDAGGSAPAEAQD